MYRALIEVKTPGKIYELVMFIEGKELTTHDKNTIIKLIKEEYNTEASESDVTLKEVCEIWEFFKTFSYDIQK